MDTNLDVYDDDDLSLLQGKQDIPEDVKEASLSPRSGYDRFAITILTKEGQARDVYPINDYETTWLSKNYFNENHNNLSDRAKTAAATRIKAACNRFDVELDKESAVNEFSEDEKVGHVKIEQSKAVSASDGNREKTANNYLFSERQRYPADHEEHLKTAENYFEKHARRMTPKRRKKFCRNLVKRANEIDYDITSDVVHRYASGSKADNAHIKLAFEARKEYLQSSQAKEKLAELFETKDDVPADVLAEALSEFDKKAGIDELQGRRFPDPYKSVQSGLDEAMDKEAAESVTYQGTTITPDDIQSIPDKKLKKHFSSTQIDEMKNNPVPVFESLPTTHKEILVGLINE